MARHHKQAEPEFDLRKVKEHIVETPLKEEMSRSFLEYAYSVIYARALPDARDGLKPVQRRIIYQMGQMNLTPDKPYMKSARAVGEVMGKLHPHGDSSIYEAMVRLAQPFAMRLPLVDGHGNFGSLDDGPAASRYTEARLAPAALGMNADINEDTVDFTANYDNKLLEPAVLPSAIPNLLVNGASGIAVGMATNMATHNLGETVNAAKHLIRHPETGLEELMRYIPGPDWPGGGIIINRDGIREAYSTGKGTLTTRAVTHIENITARKKAIVVTELPFMVGPERVLERISEGVKNHKLEGISSAIDLTDRHNGTRLVIEIKTGFDPSAVLAQLFKSTPLEENFTMNNVALVDGRPHTMGLKEMLEVWVSHRRNVVRRRSKFRMKKAQERLHLVKGLLLAILDIDEVIQVIRSSEDADGAKTRLMAIFDLDEIQAQYILDLRLRRLTRMSRIELEKEEKELKKRIEELTQILSSQEQIDQVVVEEMDQTLQNWGTSRRTLLLDRSESGELVPVKFVGGEITDQAVQRAIRVDSTVSSASAALRAESETGSINGQQSALQLDDEPCVVMMSASGLIARIGINALDIWQSRSPSDPRRADDQILSIFPTRTRCDYGIITSAGRLVLGHVADLPVLPDRDPLSLEGGAHAGDLLSMTDSTRPVRGEQAVTAVSMEVDQPPLAIATRSGMVKRWNRDAPSTMDSWQVMAFKDEHDSIVNAARASDEDRLVFISSDSSLLSFAASMVRPQGRTATGMVGIRLAEGARLIAFNAMPAGRIGWTDPRDGDDSSFPSGAVVLTVAGDAQALPGTENGAAKVTPLEVYPTKGRGTGGVRSQRFLKGQTTLVFACIGSYPIHASTENGRPVELPEPDKRRDASGTDLTAPIRYAS